MQYDFDPAMSSLENAFEIATAMGNNNEFNSSPIVMSLKQWMEETRRQLVELNPSAATSSSRSHSDGDLVLQYVKLVLPVALKLVEFLVQAKGEHRVDVDVNINNLAPTAGISEGVATATAHHDDATENPSSCPQGFKSTPSLPYASGSIAMDDCRDSGNSGVFGGHMIEAPLPLSRIHMGAVKVRLSTMTKWQQQQQTHRTQTYSRLPNNLNGVDFSSLTPRDEALLHSEATLPLKFTSDIIAPHCSMAREADHKDQNSRQENPRLLVRNPDSAAEVAIITNSPVDAPAQPFQSLSPFQAKRESQRHSKLCTDAPSNSDCTTYNENTTEYDFDMTTWKQIHLNESKHDKDDSDITSANSSKNLSSFRCGTQQQLGKSDGSEMNWDDFEMGILNEMKEYDNFIGFDQQSDKESDDSASGRNVVVGKGRVLSVFISSNDHDPNPLPKYITDCSGTTIQNNSYFYKNDYGSSTSRLVALGIIFYELFSNQEPPDEMKALLERDKGLTKSVQSMSSLHVGSRNDANCGVAGTMSSVGTSFKVRRKSSQSVKSCDEISPFILNLELANLPQSICMLVAHLLGCAEIDARDASKDCYKSLKEVQFDLQRMIRDPKYVEDVNGGMPNHFIDENVLYGRDEVISKCETLLEQSRQGECSGVLISGEAGVGKSQLAMRLRQSVLNKGGLFLSGKFDQSKDVIPLSVVAAAFNTTCHEFLERSTQNEKKALTKRLESSLGFQVRTLMALIPNLQRLTMYISENSSIFLPAPPNESCVNVEHQTHFLFYMLLESLSIVLMAPVVCCFDDIQFADPSTLGFMKSLLIYSSGQKNLFFIGCCRDEIGDFSAWLDSQESGPTLPRLHLSNLNIDAVNSMLSHELHLTPRLTLPLAEILFHKTLGNPLFLRKLLESLIEEGTLHFSIPRRRWIWNTDGIQRMKVSDGVVELLTKQICTLSKDLQTVLKIASCIGGSIDKSTMDLLLKDAQIRSPAVVISEAVKKGFFIEMESKINFVHDKVQQAAYGLIPQDQREKDHLRFGLALCSSVLQDLNEGNTPDDVFFVAINQINRGASQIAKDPVIAKLNLKAAVCAMKLSDFSSAYNYCVHGVRNLYEDHWQSQYDLSLQLCDQGAQAACGLGNVKMVKYLTSNIHANARKYDHELPSLYSTAKTLRESALYEEAKDCSLGVLRNLGEHVDTLMNNDSLVTRMQKTKSMLVIMEDAAILSMKQVEEDRVIWTMKFYLELIYTLQHMQSSKMVTISIQMMDMTLNNGLCCTSPLAFAIFGYLIVSLGDPFLGYRMGKLAINLMRKLNLVVDLSSTLTSIVYGLISWAHEPFQSIAEMHLAGYSSGNQSGDVSAAGWNYQQYLILSFVSGEKLPAVKSKALSFAKTQLAQKQKPVAYNALSIYFHSCALMGSCPDKSFQFKEDDILAHAIGASNSDLQVVYIIHQLMRSYVFKRYDEMAKNANSFHEIANSRKLIRFFFLIGTFYEGLISFSMARRIQGTNDWMERGNAALATLSQWSSFCMHNFENKVLLLKAERNFAMGGVAGTDSLYRHSIDSARQHKFVNEEAIASELAASFCLCNNDTETAISHLTKARNLYQAWGAVALVEITESKMDPWSMLFGNNNICE